MITRGCRRSSSTTSSTGGNFRSRTATPWAACRRWLSCGCFPTPRRGSCACAGRRDARPTTPCSWRRCSPCWRAAGRGRRSSGLLARSTLGGVLVTNSIATRSGAKASRASRISSSGRTSAVSRGTTPTTCGPWCAPGAPLRRRLPASRISKRASCSRRATRTRTSAYRKSWISRNESREPSCAPWRRPTATAPATPSGPAWRPSGSGSGARCRGSARATSYSSPPVLFI
mmetsp:Transcript_10746/g.31700  ORF Transcript_10746/g.31700 Transcript_10746/m.31700 type:complete len:230 (-) Transcript_10746:22-711(-)